MKELIPHEVVERRIFVIRGQFENLKFHFGTSSWGGYRKMPRAFTEYGILMLSSAKTPDRIYQA